MTDSDLKESQEPHYDVVNKAKHYNEHPSGLEAILLVRCLNFDMGCALKYVMRRHGKEYERSLKSCEWYIRDQHATGLPMLLSLVFYSYMKQYIEAEPVEEAQKFYRAFEQYVNDPIQERFDILLTMLKRLQESGK